ncbi:MAG: cytochrome c biogenesis protein CcsA, partial [Acidimicrobiales bacterium]
MRAGLIGGLALRLAVVMGVATAAASVAAVGGVAWRRWAVRGGVALAALSSVALAALVWALATGDFRLVYVADVTTRATPWHFRVAALWGGMAGSLLFWAWMCSLYAVAAPRAVGGRRPDLAPGAVAVLAGLAGAFLAVTASLADPFRSLAIPAIDGGGLNPILERPAMLYHPPLLYGGLVGTAVPAAMAVAGLVSGRLDRAWLALVRRWAGVAWLLLAVGMLAGAHWAYAELGWGGYWAWDPVENAALVPWLVLTALLHAAVVAERRGHGQRRVAGLAVVGLAAAVVGATLARSGVTVSVHAFAEARAVGAALLAVVVAVVAGGGVLLGRTRPPRQVRRHRSPVWPPSRAGALAGSTAVALALAGVVAWGSVFPLLARLWGEGQFVVGGRFFALFTAPLALAVAVGLGVGPRLRWSASAPPDLARWVAPAGSGALAGVVL